MYVEIHRNSFINIMKSLVLIFFIDIFKFGNTRLGFFFSFFFFFSFKRHLTVVLKSDLNFNRHLSL